jgi:hypothetical protein
MNHWKPGVFFDPVTTVTVGLGLAAAGKSYQESQVAARETKREGRRRRAELRKEADAERERARRLRSRQRAAYGAAGVSSNFGSPLSLQFRSLLDSIDVQSRIIAGAEQAYQDSRRRARAIQNQSLGNLISDVAGLATTGILQYQATTARPTPKAPGLTPSSIPTSGIPSGDPFSPPIPIAQ